MAHDILWQPSGARKQATALWAFAQQTSGLHGCAPDDVQGLLDWSIAEPEAFYSALWDFLEIVGEKDSTSAQNNSDIRKVRFFPGAKLNYAENLLRNAGDRLAIIAHRDDGTRREITRRQLRDRVAQAAAALRAEGVEAGDRVGAIVTNEIEAITLYLATAAVGAIWSSCSPDFGPAGASDRLNQIGPKVLVAVPGYSYAGKQIDVTASINAVAAEDSVRRIVILGELKDAAYVKDAVAYEAWLAPHPAGEIDYHRAGFDQPMAILFSSGTTGKPKCIVHRAGGLLLQHLKEIVLHCDVKPGEKFFYFTTCGWMMWNWLVSGLAREATLVTYDGNPFYPEAQRLVDLIDAEGITVFGTSAKYIDACSKAGLKPRETHDLSTLKAVLSTGSPLLPESFDYIYRDWKADLHLASISGGTDICACFVGGVPVLPVRRGEIQGAMLGMDLDALDSDGNPVPEGVPGEFVCRSAHVTMPVAFWGDDDGSRYNDAYFARFPGVWAHGDFIEKRPGGGYVIHGRSDTTLNPGGVRIGTAEIYRQVETVDEVLEALAVGQDFEGDQRVILFVRMKPGAELTGDLQKQIKSRIRSGATPRHVPAEIVAVPDIPRTRSGKISEIAVRDTIHGREVKNTTALANPECLAFYADWGQHSRQS